MENQNNLDGWREKLYGKPFVEKEQEFDKRLEEIERNNIYWFKNRPGKKPNEEHDKLYNHRLIYYNGQSVLFKIIEGSELPSVIQQQCYQAFDDVYGVKE